jgi:Xaa-Pro aminopeptidase
MRAVTVPVGSGERGIPFDVDHLDRLMAARDIDVLVATSKHNIRYLMGGYSFYFFSVMDAMGVSRYLPVFVYRQGRPELTLYIGNRLEAYEHERGSIWTPHVSVDCWGTIDAMERAIDHIRETGGAARIGIEAAFLPLDAARALADGLEGGALVDATIMLERLRAIKRPEELALLETASDLVVASMLDVLGAHGPGATSRQLFDALALAETRRGLHFEYCLVTVGASHNRVPSADAVKEGDVVSLDSGANYRGYIGDLCRMGVAGEPDQELVDLLGEVEAVQQAARGAVVAGGRGGDTFVRAAAEIARQPHGAIMAFAAHGMGLVSHEAPRLTGTGFVPYPGEDEDAPLQPGMVVSIETTLPHPTRGYVKLEDTVVVTEGGPVGYGDGARGWNRMGG